MNVIDLDGNFKQWHLTGHISKSNAKKSSLHVSAKEIIKKIYPTMQILEEVPIYIRRSEILYLDFYIPLNKKCIEVHGQQHYEFVPFFHGNRLSFLKSKKRDLEKKEWCQNNNINYIELPFNQIEKWEEIIANN